MSSPIIKLKRGAYADLPTLAVGEPGFTTDRYQLFVGSPSGNKLIGGGEFWNLNSTTVGGGIKVYEATNNGTNSIELRSPSSLADDVTYILPGSDGSEDQVLKTDGAGNLVFASVNTLSNAGLNNVVEDTTPQLGGNLDLSGRTIEGNGSIDYTGNLTVSGTASLAGASMTVTTDGISVIGVVTAANFYGNLQTTDLTGTITNDQLAGSISDDKLNQVATAGKVAISAIDIDGATDIGEAIVDGDEFIVDNGGNGTNRKTDASRLKTYILGGSSGATFSSVVVGSDTTINGTGINVAAGIVTAGGGFVGNLTGDVTGDLTGQADGADKVKTQSSVTNSNHFLTFVDSNNGSATNESLKTDAGVYYNPFTNQFTANGVNAGVLSINSVDVTSTATELNYLDGSTPGTGVASKAVVLDSSRNITNIDSLTATTLNGSLSGNVTGNVTGNVAGNLTGDVNAGVITATSAVVNGNITVTGTVDGRDVLDDGQAGDNLVTLSGVARDATNLGAFNGSTVGDAETIKGAIQDLETSLETVAGGGALAASVAVGSTDENSSHFINFVADNNTDPTQEQIRTDGDLNYNPSTKTLVATNITGELTGDVTGNVTGNLTGNVTGNVTGNATSSDTVDITDASTTNASHNVLFSSGAGAGKNINRDTDLTYNPSTNTLSAGTFSGNLTGQSDGADQVKTIRTNTSAVHYLTFVDGDNSGSAANEDLNTSLLASFNPSDGSMIVNKVTASSNFFLGVTEVTSTATELNYLDGSTLGSAVASKALVVDSSRDIDNLNIVTATTFSGNLTGNVTGNITGDLTGDVTGNVTGNLEGSADKVDVADVSSTNTDFTLTMSDGSNATAGRDIGVDSDLTYNPSTNVLTVGTLSGVVSASNIGLTGTLQFDGSGPAVTDIKDEDDMSSNSDTSLVTQQSVKSYVDTEIAGVAVTFSLSADSGTSDIFQTGQNLTISGTAEEIETAVSDNTITIGLPDDVVVGTSLSSPTIQGTTFKAVDGTDSFTIANSTGKATHSGDFEVQGSSILQGVTIQGNTSIGDQTSDLLTLTARLNSDLIPTGDGTRNLGSSSVRFKETFSDSVIGSNFTAGIVTSTTFNGTTMTLAGGGSFGGNVDIAGNLSVGGSITSINVDDFKSVSPLIEVGLEDVGDGTFQPPSFQTQYSTGIAMWYNTVGVSSDNASAAAIFASVKPGGSFRIGFATEVSFAGTGTTDGVASVTYWADIEAKGLWINDCAGQSQVISCSDSVRNLENITIDAGSFN